MNDPSQSWLLHAIPAPALLIDPGFKVLEVNPAIEQVLRRSREELIGKQLEHAVLRPAPEQLKALEQALARKDRLRLTDIHLQGLEHTDPVFELEMHPGPNVESAVFLRESRLEVRSSSDSVDCESDARSDSGQVGAQLVQQSELYAALLRALSELGEGLLLVADEKVLLANEAFLRLCGFSLEELQALPSYLDISPPEGRQGCRERLGRRIAGENVGEVTETVLQHKDGHLVHLEYSLKVFMLGGEQRLIAVFRDIGKRKRAEADVQRLNSMKDDFLAVAAHELRTPLSSISAFTQLALKHATAMLDPRIRRSLDVTTQQCARMNFLINEMLDVSRIDRGTLELRLEPMNLAWLVREVTERMRQLSDRHWLELQGLERPVMVRGDVARLEQVLTNLLSNAIKFSPEGGRVLISAERQPGCIRLFITDSGLGIPPEAQSRIFEKFFRAQAGSHVVEGLGLGLSIARDLVRRHGGDIELTSELGQGTTFMVWLPLEE